MHGSYKNVATFPYFCTEQDLLPLQTHNRVICETVTLYKQSDTGHRFKLSFVCHAITMNVTYKDSFDREVKVQTTKWSLQGGGPVWHNAGDCWPASGTSERQFYSCYTQTENIKHFESHVMSTCTVWVLSGWVVATFHLPWNIVPVHTAFLAGIISWSVEGSCTLLTVHFPE
jgi:hypothetical protein